jgi:hypothetical protein
VHVIGDDRVAELIFLHGDRLCVFYYRGVCTLVN